MIQTQSVDLCFPLEGKMIHGDSAYWVYAALSELIPELHNDADVGIHAIKGKPGRDRRLTLTSQSKLVLRVPQSQLMRYLALAGQRLQLGEHSIQLQGGFLRQLVPASRLYSRLTTIRGFVDPENFQDAAQRQLRELGIQGQVLLVPQPEIAAINQGKATGSRSPFLRRTVQIKGKQIVGFALRVQDLTAEESLLLQERGLGGRRHFGCGLFVEDRS